jgi:hypothetical protein
MAAACHPLVALSMRRNGARMRAVAALARLWP